MRFFSDGPNIPDELLTARDEGRVVFFCGSGVSRAAAGLPDFRGLAEKVIKSLCSSLESPAQKVLSAIKDLPNDTDSLISADKIFGLLEREFLTRDIEIAVAKALKPNEKSSCNAHQILIDLATSDGKVKIVTTNFDRLFDQCTPHVPSHIPPKLPDIANREEIDGVVYLHGRCDMEYTGAEGNGFVLSSSEFGNAYLAEGWATTFYKEIIRKYVVVFIGYSADDPPVSYLLEAMNKTSGQFKEVFAFQAGGEGEAISKWEYKGIHAISYNNDNHSHTSLWETLEAWSLRAKDSQKWMNAVIAKACEGPSTLSPHERGQVAHLVSTTQGAKFFSRHTPSPPATWLCVFDSSRRLAKEETFGISEGREVFSPYEKFGLDSDDAPTENEIDDTHGLNESLKDAWDFFSINSNDLKDDLQKKYYSSLNTNNAAPLLPRMQHILTWLANVSHEPCAVWWASFQKGVHYSFKRQRDFHLQNQKDETSKLVRQAWGYLDEYDKIPHDIDGVQIYGLKRLIDNQGWDRLIVKRYIQLLKPIIKVSPPNWRRPEPPLSVTNIHSLIKLEVEYTKLHQEQNIQVPDHLLPYFVEQFRRTIENAIELENELGRSFMFKVLPIHPVNNQGFSDQFMREEGLPGYVLLFSKLFTRLINSDLTLAKIEFDKWPRDENIVFSQLRFWCIGQRNFLSATEIVKILTVESNNSLWSRYVQRDLLFSLKERWSEFSEDLKKSVEDIIKKGPLKDKGEITANFKKRSAILRLDRINWLHQQGCALTFDINKFNNELKKSIPEWKSESVNQAVELGNSVRSGFVRTENNYEALLNIPISLVLSTSIELQKSADDFLLQRDPFAGLCLDRPFRAFKALDNAARNTEFPQWAWEKFLIAPENIVYQDRLILIIAHRLSIYPNSSIEKIVYSVTYWFNKIRVKLVSLNPLLFEKLFDKLNRVIKSRYPLVDSVITRNELEIRWFHEALNSPIGKLSEVLITSDSPVFGELQVGKGLPKKWKKYAKELLSNKGDLKRYVLAILNFQLSWLYAVDPKWVEKHLLKHYESKDCLNIGAVWSGFLEGARRTWPSIEIYIRLKSCILQHFLSNRSVEPRKNEAELWGVLFLSMWLTYDPSTKARVLSSVEFRHAILSASETFRSLLIWNLRGLANPQQEEAQPSLVQELVIFINEVWPLQKTIRTAEISARFVDLAFACPNNFPDVVREVMPLITVLNRNIHLPLNYDPSAGLIAEYPEDSLDLLYKALPENVTFWPYGIEETLTKIVESKPELALNFKLIELKRIWNSR